MMRPQDERLSVFMCTQAVDFRKGMASLAVLVEAQPGLNPFAKNAYVFRNRSATAVKVLYWERNGFCLWQKRLEQARFCWPLQYIDGLIAENQRLTEQLEQSQLHLAALADALCKYQDQSNKRNVTK